MSCVERVSSVKIVVNSWIYVITFVKFSAQVKQCMINIVDAYDYLFYLKTIVRWLYINQFWLDILTSRTFSIDLKY